MSNRKLWLQSTQCILRISNEYLIKSSLYMLSGRRMILQRAISLRFSTSKRLKIVGVLNESTLCMTAFSVVKSSSIWRLLNRTEHTLRDCQGSQGRICYLKDLMFDSVFTSNKLLLNENLRWLSPKDLPWPTQIDNEFIQQSSFSHRQTMTAFQFPDLSAYVFKRQYVSSIFNWRQSFKLVAMLDVTSFLNVRIRFLKFRVARLPSGFVQHADSELF